VGKFETSGVGAPRSVYPIVPVLPRAEGLSESAAVRGRYTPHDEPRVGTLRREPEWRLLLAAYQQKIAADSVEWSQRITAVKGLAPDQLSVIPGKLIALGMLKFEIGSRADGVQYQLTSLGRQALLAPGERQLTPEWLLEAEAPAA